MPLTYTNSFCYFSDMPDFLVQGLLTDLSILLLVGIAYGVNRVIARREELAADRAEFWRRYRM